MVARAKEKLGIKPSGGSRKRVEDDNGPNVNLRDLGSPSGIPTGGGKGRQGSKNNAAQPASSGRHSDRSSSSADDIPRNNPSGPYGVLPSSAKSNPLDNYEAPDSPLNAPATVNLKARYAKAPRQSRAKEGAAAPAGPVGGPNPNQPVVAHSHGSSGNVNAYGDVGDVHFPQNIPLPPPLVKPPSNAALFLRKIKPQTKKGVAIYTGISVILGGVVTTAVLGGLGYFDTDKTVPTLADKVVRPGVTRTEAGGITKTGIKDFILSALAMPSDESAESAINPASYLLYGTTDSTDAGSRTLTRQGKWTVTDEGLLSYEPDQALDFGTAEILVSVADVSGRRSDRARFCAIYGPLGSKLEVKEVDPQQVTPPINLTSAVTPVGKGTDSAVDFSTLQLVYRDTGPNGTPGDTIGTEIVLPGVGTWRVVNGAVTFAPALGFMGSMASIGFQVRDKRGILSSEGAIVLLFKPVAMVFPNPDPMAKPTLGFMPAIAVNSAARTEFSISSVGALAENSLEIAASAAGPFVKQLTIVNEGSWAVDGNALAFLRSPDFLGAPSPVFYRAKGVSGVQSDAFPLALSIFAPPVALDDSFNGLRANIDVLANDRVVYQLEGNQIDRGSLEFLNITSGNPADPVPQLSADGKTAVVPGQGTWEVNAENQRVSFVPVAGFDGKPVPIYYSVKDTKGSESGPAKIEINPASASVVMAVNTLQGMAPAAFWASFAMQFGRSPLDEVLVATFLLSRTLSKGLNTAQLMNISAPDVGLPEVTRKTLFMGWANARFSVPTLVSLVENRTWAELRGKGAESPIALQVLRLGEMIVAMDTYFNTLAALRT